MDLFCDYIYIYFVFHLKQPAVKKQLREDIIRRYHVWLVKRRRERAEERLREVIQKGLSIQDEAARLEQRELHDKKLDRGYYYHPNEPAVFVSENPNYKLN